MSNIGDVAPEKIVCPTHGCYHVITAITGGVLTSGCPRCLRLHYKLRYPPMPTVPDEKMPDDWRNCDHCKKTIGVDCNQPRRKVRVQCRTFVSKELKE